METNDQEFMTPEAIQAWPAYKDFPPLDGQKQRLVDRMKSVDQFTKTQAAGRRWAIGCVSLEVTQRCNLDCTLCYLSDSSEAVKDIPLQEIFRRIDVIYRHYGPGTDIQISGGDPTLRKKEDLVAIVKRITDYKMEASLFTNGILAKRDLLKSLAEVGLVDVAFHVDMTQERRGYESEMDLNRLRLKYIEAAKGLGINIFFNTTIFDGNFKEIPRLVEFFKENCDQVDFCSFQIQAEQGRGVLRERDFMITQDSVIEQLEKGAGTKINFDMPLIGHPKCNKKAVMLESGGKMFNLADTRGFFTDMIEYAPKIERQNPSKTALGMWTAVLKRPKLWFKAGVYLKDLFVSMLPSLFRSRFKVNKLSFFIHNFMDACKLEEDRIQSCVFMVATNEGPISMCMHNAKRDEYILSPFKVKTDEGEKVFDPLVGEIDVDGTQVQVSPKVVDPKELPMKHLKGRYRKEKMEERQRIKDERKQKQLEEVQC